MLKVLGATSINLLTLLSSSLPWHLPMKACSCSAKWLLAMAEGPGAAAPFGFSLAQSGKT